MGQKTHPKAFRLSLTKDWNSRWFAKKKSDFNTFIKEDYEIRKKIYEKLKYSALSKVFIERAGNRIRIKIYTGRPGMVIGRKGKELDKIKEEIKKITNYEIILDIQEVKQQDIAPEIVAQNIALQLEKRVSYRRAMKKAVVLAMNMGIKGIKIRCSGRLGGADIARKKDIVEGSAPLQTLRSNIEYGTASAMTMYGVVGVKCWICKD